MTRPHVWIVAVVGFASLGLSTPSVADKDDDQRVAGQIWSGLRRSAVVEVIVECTDAKSEVGTGFVVGGRYVLTNRHVLLGCFPNGDYQKGKFSAEKLEELQREAAKSTKEIKVKSSDGRSASITESGSIEIDRESDFALVDIGATDASHPSLCIAPNRAFQAGELATVFGYGLRNAPAVRFGRIDDPETREHWAQFSANIGPGWSGGPVTNARGYVVGLVVGGNPAAGFALPLFRVYSRLVDRNVLPDRLGKERALSEDERWAACDDPAKVTGYRNTEVIPGVKFGPVDGGFDPERACNSKIAELAPNKPPASRITGSNYRERSYDSGFRHIKYEYWCDITVQSAPIYEKSRRESCGLRDARSDPLKCFD